MTDVLLQIHGLVQLAVLLHHPAVRLLPSGDDVFCNLNFKAGSPEKFLEDVLSVLPLTADNCFESVL